MLGRLQQWMRPDVLKLNQQRLQSSKVKYVQADIFTWQPAELLIWYFLVFGVPCARYAF